LSVCLVAERGLIHRKEFEGSFVFFSSFLRLLHHFGIGGKGGGHVVLLYTFLLAQIVEEFFGVEKGEGGGEDEGVNGMTRKMFT
jgi:hypothetical protein